MDIFNVLRNLNTYVSKKQVLDITDLIPECAQGAVDQVGARFMKATQMNGRTYAIPTDKGVALNGNWYYRKSVMDELGIDPSTIKSVEDLPAVFDKLLEIHPEMVPFVGSQGDSGILKLLWNDDIDFLGDGEQDSLGGVVIGDDPTVVNLYETQQFKDAVTMARDWYNKGYIGKDSATTTSTVYEQLASGKAFSYLASQAGSYGAAEASTLVGETIESIVLANPYLSTNSLGVAWAINSQCKVPESALKFLNLTYTNEDVVNYLVFGIEGRDYVKVNDREVEYPKGLNADRVHGIIYCATFGKSMQVRYEKVGRTGKNRFTGEQWEPIDKAYYICQTYNKLGKNACTSHKIEARDLYNLVLKDIQELAKTALKDADAFYQRLSSRMERRYLLDASQTQKECQRLESRNREIDEMFLSLYTDKAKGILTEQRFMKLTATLEQEQEANQKRLQDLLLMMRHSDEQENEVRTFIKEIRRYAAIEELDEAVLNRLISKILVGEVKKIDGQKVQEVRIVYNFVGEIPEITA